MKKYRKQRNWSLYNQKLKKIARIDFFISQEAIENWHYNGKRSSGGKVLYSGHVIELCLLMREFYRLAYRQMQGFVESVLESLDFFGNSTSRGNLYVDPVLESSRTLLYAAVRGEVSPSNSSL